MDLLATLQPTGAKTTEASGSILSTGSANGDGGFEQVLLGLLVPGLGAPQGLAQSATGSLSVNDAAKAAAGAPSIIVTGETGGAGLTGSIGLSGSTGINGSTGLTGATVLGIKGTLPTAGSGGPVLPQTVTQGAPGPKGGDANPITAALTGTQPATPLSAAPAAAGKTPAGTQLLQGSVPASDKKAATTLLSTSQSKTAAGSAGAAANAAGSSVTAALNEKPATAGAAPKKPASPIAVAGEVATAKTTIKSAVINAPGAGDKLAKATAKSSSSATKGSKSSGLAGPALPKRNGPTVAQAAQAAAKASVGKSHIPARKAQPIEPFGPTSASPFAAGGEGTSLVSISSITSSTGAELATHTAAARAAAPAAPVPQQVAVQFSQALAQGSDRISIQLQPESLGRVEVEIELSKDGRLSAVFIAERPETLEMLQRDSRALERALNEAGIRTDADGLSFSLRGEGGHSQQSNNSPGGSTAGAKFDGIEGEDVPILRAPTINVDALLDIQV